MQLQNCESAVVELRKLRDYCLNTAHLRGQHKAQVFASALGLKAENAEWLRDEILKNSCNDDAVLSSEDERRRVWAKALFGF